MVVQRLLRNLFLEIYLLEQGQSVPSDFAPPYRHLVSGRVILVVLCLGILDQDYVTARENLRYFLFFLTGWLLCLRGATVVRLLLFAKLKDDHEVRCSVCIEVAFYLVLVVNAHERVVGFEYFAYR